MPRDRADEPRRSALLCLNCSTDNSSGSKFCNNCGERLAAVCPSCGTSNAPGARFCQECGTPLASASAAIVPRTGAAATGIPVGAGNGAAAQPARGQARTAAEPEAERKLVSVLFADLVGFTPFAEERDAEDVRETLSTYFDLSREVIARYGGTVEKFIGDAVMAVWGAPVAFEDDAERAVRAALDLVDSVRTLGPGIQARAGVLTGEAAVTIGAVGQGMVAGDIVNTASRLQAAAVPGSVLVGEGTQRAASSSIVFEPAGDQTLKGKASPVPAWRALRVVAERGGRNRSETLEAPFVGRDIELRLLKDLYHATTREGRARLVSITGIGGIGKSRLAWEFLKYIDGLVETVWWHHGRSPAYGEGITFWALGEMVRGRAGLVEGDDEATTREKLKAALAEHVKDPGEQAWIEPALLALLGFETGIASDQLFAAWRTFFERISDTATVVMVFEDLQWADAGLLDFVEQLLEWSRSHPILVITLARPELLDRRSQWGAGKRGFAATTLEPLPEPAMRELLGGLVPGLPEAAIRAIVGRAEGVPLYAVETVRMLLADGKLEAVGDGTYRLIGDVTSVAVPDSLTSLIAARLDGLDADDRSLLQDASVLGHSFSPAAVAAIAGADGDGLESRLQGLVRRELLTLEADPRSPERGQYAFVQELIREVAYNTLAKKERKARHLAAARYFESLGTDEIAAALAGHYLAAYQSAPAGQEADALAAQARIALKGAAERAAALGAHDQAISFFDQALSVTSDQTERADLLERVGLSASKAGRHDRAEGSLREALALRAELGDRLATARTVKALADVLHSARRFDAAITILEPAATEYADLAPDPVAAALGARLAFAQVSTDRPAVALATIEPVLVAAEHGDMVEVLAEALVAKGMGLGESGRLREALGVVRAGQDLAREHGLNELLLLALVVDGYTLGEIDPSTALSKYREGFELARRIGHRPRMLLFANNIGYTGYVIGDWDAGLDALESRLAEDLERTDRMLLLSNAAIIRASRGEDVSEAIAELREMGKSEGEAMRGAMMDTVASAAMAQGRFDEAAKAWRELPRLTASYGPSAHYQAARPALWARDLEGARGDLAAIDATGMHGKVIEVRHKTVEAGIAAVEGRAADALALYREARRGWHDIGLVWDDTLTAIDMATLLDPSEPDVQSAAGEARATLVRLGAQPYLERLDAALARSPKETTAEAAATKSTALPSAEPV